MARDARPITAGMAQEGLEVKAAYDVLLCIKGVRGFRSCSSSQVADVLCSFRARTRCRSQILDEFPPVPGTVVEKTVRSHRCYETVPAVSCGTVASSQSLWMVALSLPLLLL